MSESGYAEKIHVMTHEANQITTPLIREGVVQYVISQNPLELLGKAMELAALRPGSGFKERHLIDFGVYTNFNLPNYSGDASVR